MNWYYIENEHKQRLKDRERAAARERLLHAASDKRPLSVRRIRILLIFATIGHWLIAWRR